MEKRRKTLGNRENVEKHWKTVRIRGKHRKTQWNMEKRRKTLGNRENVEKHWKTGRIRGKHRKTR